MSASAATRLREARDDRGFGRAALVFALVLVGNLDHALEREDAVEPRRRGIDPSGKAA